MPRAKGELYLIDKDGFEYGFNQDMAKHTSLYAVMCDGVRVPWTGSPPVQGGPASQVVLADDKFPTEAELLQAKTLAARVDPDQIAMAAQAKQSGQGTTVPVVPRMPQAQVRTMPSVEGNETEEAAADLAVAGKVEPPSTVGGIRDYKADQPIKVMPAPPAPPLPSRRAPPRPPIRP